MSSCKALNETAKIAKITRITKFCKAVDENSQLVCENFTRALTKINGEMPRTNANWFVEGS